MTTFTYTTLKTGEQQIDPTQYILSGETTEIEHVEDLTQYIASVLGVQPWDIKRFFVDPYGKKYGHTGLQIFVRLKRSKQCVANNVEP